jgi:hypothetical protein
MLKWETWNKGGKCGVDSLGGPQPAMVIECPTGIR